MGMDDYTSNLIERGSSDFVSLFRNFQESTIPGQVPSICLYIDNLIHSTSFNLDKCEYVTGIDWYQRF